MEAGEDATPQSVGRAPAILRSAAVGLLALGLGLGAHAVSGGALPGALILCGFAALAVLVATLVAQARMPAWAVWVIIGAAQHVLHWLIGGFGGAASSVSGAVGHHSGNVPVGSGAAQGHSPEVMLMLHTHLAAALLTGWAVTRYQVIVRWLTGRAPRGHPLLTKEGTPVR